MLREGDEQRKEVSKQSGDGDSYGFTLRDCCSGAGLLYPQKTHNKKNNMLAFKNFRGVVGETDKEFSFNFKVENIKIFPGTYEVVISKKLLARFVNKANNLTYFIALEPDSTFVE